MAFSHKSSCSFRMLLFAHFFLFGFFHGTVAVKEKKSIIKLSIRSHDSFWYKDDNERKKFYFKEFPDTRVIGSSKEPNHASNYTYFCHKSSFFASNMEEKQSSTLLDESLVLKLFILYIYISLNKMIRWKIQLWKQFSVFVFPWNQHI